MPNNIPLSIIARSIEMVRTKPTITVQLTRNGPWVTISIPDHDLMLQNTDVGPVASGNCLNFFSRVAPPVTEAMNQIVDININIKEGFKFSKVIAVKTDDGRILEKKDVMKIYYQKLADYYIDAMADGVGLIGLQEVPLPTTEAWKTFNDALLNSANKKNLNIGKGLESIQRTGSHDFGTALLINRSMFLFNSAIPALGTIDNYRGQVYKVTDLLNRDKAERSILNFHGDFANPEQSMEAIRAAFISPRVPMIVMGDANLTTEYVSAGNNKKVGEHTAKFIDKVAFRRTQVTVTSGEPPTKMVATTRTFDILADAFSTSFSERNKPDSKIIDKSRFLAAIIRPSTSTNVTHGKKKKDDEILDKTMLLANAIASNPQGDIDKYFKDLCITACTKRRWKEGELSIKTTSATNLIKNILKNESLKTALGVNNEQQIKDKMGEIIKNSSNVSSAAPAPAAVNPAENIAAQVPQQAAPQQTPPPSHSQGNARELAKINALIQKIENDPKAYVKYNARPSLTNATQELLHNFLMEMKKTNPSLYQNMTDDQFLNRLLQDRPDVFFGPQDFWKTRDNKQGTRWPPMENGVELTVPGTDRPYLSYAEMELASLIGVGSNVEFINDGNRKNIGIEEKNKNILANIHGASNYGAIGVRFENNKCRSRQFMCPGEYDKAGDNKASQAEVELWAAFYRARGYKGELFPPTEQQDDLVGKDKENIPVIRVNRELYRIKMKEIIAAYLADANARGNPYYGVYCHVVGLGAGAWAQGMNANELADIQLGIYQELIASGNYPNIRVLDMSHFEPSNVFAMSNSKPIKTPLVTAILGAKNQQVEVIYTKTNPGAALPVSYFLMHKAAQYAWDPGAKPGNEYFIGAQYFGASGDPAAACACADLQAQNPAINPNMNASVKLVSASVAVQAPQQSPPAQVLSTVPDSHQVKQSSASSDELDSGLVESSQHQQPAAAAVQEAGADTVEQSVASDFKPAQTASAPEVDRANAQQQHIKKEICDLKADIKNENPGTPEIDQEEPINRTTNP